MISSQTTRSGRAARARAIATRCARRRTARPGTGSPCAPAGGRARAGRRPRLSPPRARGRAARGPDARSRRATRRRGFSESFGFWKTIWIRRRASRERRLALRRERLAVEDDPPRRRLVQAGHAARDRRLAAAGLADEGEALARGDGERDVGRGDHRLVAAAVHGGEPLDLEQLRRRPGPRPHGEHRLEPDRRRLAPLEAAHVVARRGRFERRDLLGAPRDPLCAARRERAAGRALAHADGDARDAAERGAARRGPGSTPIRPRVYGCRGRASSSAAGPLSTMRPAYITAIRSAI